MSTVYVGNKIRFKAGASTKANVEGNMLPSRMCSVDWFDQTAIDTSNDYTVTVAGSSDTIALSAGGLTGVTAATGAVDNDVSFLATGLIFDISQEPEIETKIKIVDVSGTLVYFGFSDAVTESTPAATIDYDTGTLTAAATDAVGFVVDADKESSRIYAASVATSGSVTATAAAPIVAWADNESKTLRIRLDASGNAYFYIDGVQVGYQAVAVTDVPLCAIFNFGTRAADGANTVYARYLAKFQDIA